MMVMESGVKQIKKSIRNWTEGYKASVLQQVALVEQFYPESVIEDFDEQTKRKEKRYRTIRLKGEKMYKSPETGDLESEKIQGNSYFELKPEYLSLKGNADVEIDIDQMLPMSRGVKAQRIEAVLAQVVPILANPELLNAPGVIDVLRE